METILDTTLALAGFTIIGVIASTIIEVLQTNLSPLQTKCVTLIISIVIGALIAWGWDKEIMTTILWTLGSASTIYGLFLKQSNEFSR